MPGQAAQSTLAFSRETKAFDSPSSQAPNIKPGVSGAHLSKPQSLLLQGQGLLQERKEARRPGGGQLWWKSRLFTHSTSGVDFCIHCVARIDPPRCHIAVQGVPPCTGLEGLNRAELPPPPWAEGSPTDPSSPDTCSPHSCPQGPAETLLELRPSLTYGEYQSTGWRKRDHFGKNTNIVFHSKVSFFTNYLNAYRCQVQRYRDISITQKRLPKA